MKTFRVLLTILHLVLLVLLYGTLLNAVIAPEKFGFLNLLSLFFPIGMVLYVLICFFWILLRQKRVIIFLFLPIFLIPSVQRWLQFSTNKETIPTLKILTFNIKSSKIGEDKIPEFIQSQKADLVLLQEENPDFTLKNYQQAKFYIMSIYSKYPIVKTGALFEGVGNSVFADVKIRGKMYRIINIYLEPFALEKEKMEELEQLGSEEHHFGYFLGKLIPNFKTHQKQVEAVEKCVQESPYPVILAGDFNAVPNSYEYYHLVSGLQDAFVEVGSGSATSFRDYWFPLRIDYVFTSKNIQPVRYLVHRNVALSDHYPVTAEFTLQ